MNEYVKERVEKYFEQNTHSVGKEATVMLCWYHAEGLDIDVTGVVIKRIESMDEEYIPCDICGDKAQLEHPTNHIKKLLEEEDARIRNIDKLQEPTQKESVVRTRYKWKKETKGKMSKANRGNKYCFGRVLTQEHKDKIGKANLGRKHTPEAKAKMSIAKKKRHQLKKKDK